MSDRPGAEPLEALRDSTPHLSDRQALDEVYQQEGYLFLRGVLPLAEVDRVRGELLAGLAAQNIGRSGPSDDQLDLARASDVDMTALHEVVDYRSLYDHEDTVGFFEWLFGEPVWMFRSVQIRCMPVAEEWSLAPSHQDANYVGPNDDYRTIWTPLTTVTQSMGGIGLVPGSHKAGLLETVEVERHRPDGSRAPNHLTIPAESIHGSWAAAPQIDPGDVLVFSPYLVHRSLPNRSPEGQARLSLDTRVQPLSSRRGPSASFTAPELDRLVVERGVSALKEEVSAATGGA